MQQLITHKCQKEKEREKLYSINKIIGNLAPKEKKSENNKHTYILKISISKFYKYIKKIKKNVSFLDLFFNEEIVFHIKHDDTKME